MTDTGRVGWAGHPPEVRIGERVLLSQLPEEERDLFLAFSKGRYEMTRSGEPVFSKALYHLWKQAN